MCENECCQQLIWKIGMLMVPLPSNQTMKSLSNCQILNSQLCFLENLNNSLSRGINPNFWSPFQFQRSQNDLKLQQSRIRNHIFNKIHCDASIFICTWIKNHHQESSRKNGAIKTRGKFATIRKQSTYVSHLPLVLLLVTRIWGFHVGCFPPKGIQNWI